MAKKLAEQFACSGNGKTLNWCYTRMHARTPFIAWHYYHKTTSAETTNISWAV